MNYEPKVTNKSEKSPEVRRELEQLHKTVELISATIGQLRDRIHPILKLCPNGLSETAKDEALVPLADEIRSAHRKLSHCNSDIQEIIDVCEL